MPTLIDETPEALSWIANSLAAYSSLPKLGKLVSGVVWTDESRYAGDTIPDAALTTYVANINESGLPMFKGHDPGIPVGRIIAAQQFTTPNATTFIVAIFALYEPEYQLSFSSLAIDDPLAFTDSPQELKPLKANWIDFGTDPLEVDTQWLDEVLINAPIPFKRVELSHNAAESVKELIRVGLPYAVLLWNPLVTKVANKAAEDIYAGIQSWLQHLWKMLQKRKDPIVVIQAHYSECEVSFLFRGKNVEQHYSAHSDLPLAAAQATRLIEVMLGQNTPPCSITYEYDDSRWYPSYAVLRDGRIVSDRMILLALEQLPSGLSMGLRRGKR